MRKALCFSFFLVALAGLVFAGTDPSDDTVSNPVPVAIPGGAQGIGLDDVLFSQKLHQLLVPSGRTGKLNLIDVDTRIITSIGGFSQGKNAQGGHSREAGTTSADAGGGFIFAADRAKKTVVVIDPVAQAIVASAALAGGCDYVRYVAAAHEVWVTDPHGQQIEVFSFGAAPKPALTHARFIAVPGGPESLVIDNTRQRAYTNLWLGTTMAIDIKTHAIVAKWPNSCGASRGLALDETRGFLFVGGKEGWAAALDLNHDGRLLSRLQAGSGVDIIAYNPTLVHLYLPGGSSATMAIVEVSPTGQLSLFKVVKTAKGSRCVAADDRNGVWVADPDHGRLLRFKDSF